MPHRRAADPIAFLRGNIDALNTQIKALEDRPIRNEVSLQLLRHQLEEAEGHLADHEAERHVPTALLYALRGLARGRRQTLRLPVRGRQVDVVVTGGSCTESGARHVYDHLNQAAELEPGRHHLDRYERLHLPEQLAGYRFDGDRTVIARMLQGRAVAQVARQLRRTRLGLVAVPALAGLRLIREIGVAPTLLAGAAGSAATAAIAAAVYIGPLAPGQGVAPSSSTAPVTVDAQFEVPVRTSSSTRPARRARSRAAARPAVRHAITPPLPVRTAAPATTTTPSKEPDRPPAVAPPPPATTPGEQPTSSAPADMTGPS